MLPRQSVHLNKILRFACSGSMQVSTMENETNKCEHEEASKRKYDVSNRLIAGVYEDDLLKVDGSFTSLKLFEAIEALNSLVSNRAVIQEVSKQNLRRSRNVEITNKYLKVLGIDLDKLSDKVIHITGTKGKGSTCAITESILRSYGFTTGFFSSPHLFSVTERIRINGQPISEQAFSCYFWKIYNKLLAHKEHDEDMPSYFKFLTIMAFHIFIEENVDVAIIEVGIGGEFDCTNALRNTPVFGITPIGFDHTNILGDSIEKIAWMKAGIMKEGSIGFTCLDQPPDAMTVLYERAEEKKCKLVKVPKHIECLSEINPVLYLNASLAIRLAHAWMYVKKGMNLLFHSNEFSWDDDINVPEKTVKAVKKCIWPGRFQILKNGNVTYYLDGAHTVESIDHCSKWFSNNISRDHGKRILIFNVTGNRNPLPLFQLLISCSFDESYFCPNTLSKSSNIPKDIICKMSSSVSNETCWNNKRNWEKIGGGKAVITESILETLEIINSETSQVNVLVTGSLHLIGNTLKILQPDLWS